MHATVRLMFIGWMVALLTSCGARQKREQNFPVPGSTDLVVEEFTIKGVQALDEGDLRAGLRTQEATWRTAVPWLPVLGEQPYQFNYVYWRQDLDRIRTYYKARGYFDVKIVSENIRENPEAGTVRLSLTLSEGTPVKIASVDVDGLMVKDVEIAQIVGGLPVREGEVFTQAEFLEAREQIKRELENVGYAYANVEAKAVVEPKKLSATIVFHIDPGPRSFFGDIDIVGLEDIDEARVREAITIQPGDRYSPEDLQRTQERIYDLGVFAVVKVNPQLSQTDEAEEGDDADVESTDESADVATGGLSDLIGGAQEAAETRVTLDPVVPVTIRVQEAKLWNVRVGAGVAADVARQDVHGRADWGSRNFLGGLRKLEHFNTAGYAWAPGVFAGADARNEGVLVDSELRFTQPQFIERFTNAEVRLRFERLVERGFSLTSPTASLGLRRRFFRSLNAEVSYNFSLYVLSNVDRSLLDPDLQLQPEYILEYLQQRVVLDERNDFLNPTRGFLIEAQLQEAARYVGWIPGNPYGSSFDYVAPLLGGEVYFPMRKPLFVVLALRSRLATIYNIGRDKLPPIPQRLYAGGADSIRSFGRAQLSLYSLEREAIPIGGLTKFEGSIEPRFRIAEDLGGAGALWVAPFFDVATVLEGSLFYSAQPGDPEAEGISSITSSLLYGTGLGAWLVSPLGPIRLDFGYTISDITQDARFRRCLVQVDYNSECPENAFVPLDEDPIQDRLSRFNIILGIGHSF